MFTEFQAAINAAVAKGDADAARILGDIKALEIRDFIAKDSKVAPPIFQDLTSFWKSLQTDQGVSEESRELRELRRELAERLIPAVGDIVGGVDEVRDAVRNLGLGT